MTDEIIIEVLGIDEKEFYELLATYSFEEIREEVMELLEED